MFFFFILCRCSAAATGAMSVQRGARCGIRDAEFAGCALFTCFTSTNTALLVRNTFRCGIGEAESAGCYCGWCVCGFDPQQCGPEGTSV